MVVKLSKNETENNITIKVSAPLIAELRKLDPKLKEIPATYIVDMLLREKKEQLEKKKGESEAQ
jgi:hypothetical protein